MLIKYYPIGPVDIQGVKTISQTSWENPHLLEQLRVLFNLGINEAITELHITEDGITIARQFIQRK